MLDIYIVQILVTWKCMQLSSFSVSIRQMKDFIFRRFKESKDVYLCHMTIYVYNCSHSMLYSLYESIQSIRELRKARRSAD